MKLIKVKTPTVAVFELRIDAGEQFLPDKFAKSIAGMGNGELLELDKLTKREILDLIEQSE